MVQDASQNDADNRRISMGAHSRSRPTESPPTRRRKTTLCAKHGTDQSVYKSPLHGISYAFENMAFSRAEITDGNFYFFAASRTWPHGVPLFQRAEHGRRWESPPVWKRLCFMATIYRRIRRSHPRCFTARVFSVRVWCEGTRAAVACAGALANAISLESSARTIY